MQLLNQITWKSLLQIKSQSRKVKDNFPDMKQYSPGDFEQGWPICFQRKHQDQGSLSKLSKTRSSFLEQGSLQSLTFLSNFQSVKVVTEGQRGSH